MTRRARTIAGRSALREADGPILVAVGVFDGLHRGHVWLLEHLVREAWAREVHPAVITFDAHPDAVLVGSAPPLLMDPAERLDRLGEMGVETVIVEHFDDVLRRTPYDAFVHGVTTRCRLTGFVMTADAAFGHERAGTPETLAALGARDGFDVIVVEPFVHDGREIRSSEIRAAIAAGDLATAELLLGRPYAISGTVDDEGGLGVAMPVVLPPPGAYDAVTPEGPVRITVSAAAGVRVLDGPDDPVRGWTRIELSAGRA